MNEKLTCLVISDLHTLVGKKIDDVSYLSYNNEESDFEKQLLCFLESKNDRSFDCLICPGDIGNKADKKTFHLGWTLLHKITALLSIPNFYCVPGNHDYDSTRKDSIDPRSYLKYIQPLFPTKDDSLNTRFWAWNWFVVKQATYNVLMVDTSALQGYGKKEFQHGRIITETSDQIIEFVCSEEFVQKPINILILHHNPYSIVRGDVNSTEDFAVGADYLINKLTTCMKGPWMIIHGHKHIPAISYVTSGSTESPVVFSAGTLAAKFFDDYTKYEANQLYFLEIDLGLTESNGRATGRFETYEYSSVLGWRPACSEIFPATGGFGSLDTPTIILRKIQDLLKVEKVLRNETLNYVYSMIRYLAPDDRQKLEILLFRNNIIVNKNEKNSDVIDEIIGDF